MASSVEDFNNRFREQYPLARSDEESNKIFSGNIKNSIIIIFLSLRKQDLSWGGIESQLGVILHIFDDVFENARFEKSSSDYIEVSYYEWQEQSKQYEGLQCFKDLLTRIPYCDCNLYQKITCNRIRLFGRSIVMNDNADSQSKVLALTDYLHNFPNLILNSLQKFEELFAKYIFIFLPKEVEKEQDIFKIPEEDREQFPDSCPYGFIRPDKIISYNYKNYSVKNFDLKKDDVCFVHGYFSCNKNVVSDLKQCIIFGIDSAKIGSFTNKNYNIFTKKIRRVLNNTDMSKLNGYCNNIQNVIVYGHSLDFADNVFNLFE